MATLVTLCFIGLLIYFFNTRKTDAQRRQERREANRRETPNEAPQYQQETSQPTIPSEPPLLKSTAPSIIERVLPILDVSFVAIDFETANRRRGSACAIGMCKVLNGVVAARYVSVLRPEPFEFESRNVYIHGIDASRAEYASTIAEDWANIQAFVGGLPLVAHNASFDKSVLDSSLIANGLSASGWKIDCTLEQSKRILKDRASYKLNDLSREFGITLKHHDAGSDSEACALLQLHLLHLDGASNRENTPIAPVTKRDILSESDELKGLTFVFTGEMESYSREDIEAIAESHGAFVRNSVSRKTDYLVRGHIGQSTKLTRAYELNTKIINEKAFFKLIDPPKKNGTKQPVDKLTKYEALSKYNDYVEMTRRWHSEYAFDEPVNIEFGAANSKKMEEAVLFMEAQDSYETYTLNRVKYHKAIFNTTRIVDLRYIMFLTQGFKSRQIVVRDKIVSQSELSSALYYCSISDFRRGESISEKSEERAYLEDLFDEIKSNIYVGV